MKLISTLLLFLATSLSAADGTLRVRTLDKDTAKPLHCRVSIKGSDGQWRWGKDLAGADLVYGGLARMWSSGDLSVPLPPGEAEVVVSRPFEYLPFTGKVLIKEGETANLDVQLERLINLAERGWFGGDIHVHVVHGEKHFKVDIPTVVPISRAEGESWVSFAQAWTSVTDRQPTPVQLEEICKKLCDEQYLCGWGMEHPKDHLGHMAAFPINKTLTYLEAVGGNDYHAYTSRTGLRNGLTHFEILRGLKACESLAMYSHPTREYGGTKESVGNIGREIPFDVIAAPASLEALDIFCDAPRHENDEKLAYYLLNRGLRFAICGLTDVCYDRKGGERPGDTRTYVYLPPGTPRTFPQIVKAVRARHTFATTGPLLAFSIDKAGIGDVLEAGKGALQGQVEAWMAIDYNDPAKPAGLNRIEILRNGVVWKTFPANGERTAKLNFEVNESGDAWYAARVIGTEKTQIAISSPIFFQTAAYKPPVPATAIVKATVEDAAGKKLDGTVRAIEFSVTGSREVSKAEFKNGAFMIKCPADCRIEISAPGFETQSKSLFLDVEEIYDEMFLPIRRAQLIDDAFYEKVRRALENVELKIKMEKGK